MFPIVDEGVAACEGVEVEAAVAAVEEGFFTRPPLARISASSAFIDGRGGFPEATEGFEEIGGDEAEEAAGIEGTGIEGG